MFPLTYVYQEQVSNAVVKFYSVFFLSTSVEIPWLNTCLDISMVPECFKLFFAEYILSQIFGFLMPVPILWCKGYMSCLLFIPASFMMS